MYVYVPKKPKDAIFYFLRKKLLDYSDGSCTSKLFIEVIIRAVKDLYDPNPKINRMYKKDAYKFLFKRQELGLELYCKLAKLEYDWVKRIIDKIDYYFEKEKYIDKF